jgi:hypothetical protein
MDTGEATDTDYGSRTAGRTHGFDPLWTWPRGVEFEALGLVEVINRFERATELAKDLREVFMGLDEGGAEPERLAKFHHGFG